MTTKAIVYADSTLNIIDGSSIWLATVSQLLSSIVDEVHVLSKTPVTETHLVGPLLLNNSITIHESLLTDSLSPAEAAEHIEKLVGDIGPQMILVRGFEACAAAAKKKRVATRLFSYITDLQFPIGKLSVKGITRLRGIAKASKRMFAQTESARSYLEAIAPEAAGKTLLLPPVVPDSFFLHQKTNRVDSQQCQHKIKIVYAGKFARDWRTLEMLELPRLLKERGCDAHLTVIGNKFQNERSDPTWRLEMEQKLGAFNADPESEVTWVGPIPREEVGALIAQADIGLSWRSAALDSSLEMSSKVLEYGASGAAPLINRTADHEALLGASYPFFIDEDSMKCVVETICGNLPHLNDAQLTAGTISGSHSFTAISRALRASFDQMNLFEEASDRKRAQRLLIATHDDKFMGDLLDLFATLPDVNSRIDRWTSLRNHDEAASRNACTWAETILCEWAGPNAVWYSRNKPEGARLIVRLHAFELRGPWISDIRVDAVDDWVFVSEPFRDLAIDRLLLDPARCHVIHNGIDTSDFWRPKLADAQFHLGLVGYVTFNKRPDRALDLIERLCSEDPRYILHVKGRPPWEYEYEWKKPSQRVAYEDFFERISSSPTLQEQVVFEPFSSDIASWLRQIGFVLSPSATESFHLAPAEGMASGAVPIIWDRPGARQIFGHDFIIGEVEDAADRILRLRDPQAFAGASMDSRRQADVWSQASAHREWITLLRDPAQYRARSIPHE